MQYIYWLIICSDADAAIVVILTRAFNESRDDPALMTDEHPDSNLFITLNTELSKSADIRIASEEVL